MIILALKKILEEISKTDNKAEVFADEDMIIIRSSKKNLEIALDDNGDTDEDGPDIGDVFEI